MRARINPGKEATPAQDVNRNHERPAASVESRTAARTHRLNIHDTYLVNWTAEMLARDIVQNYYDSVRSEAFTSDIIIEVDERLKRVRLSGPTQFNIELLWRIGVGTKGGDSEGRYAGGFGEGFIVAIMQVLRGRPATKVSVRVGGRLAEFRYEAIKVGTVSANELVCDERTDTFYDGSELLIEDCAPRLLKAFGRAREFFFYPENPYLGEELSASGEQWYLRLPVNVCKRPTCTKCAPIQKKVREEASEPAGQGEPAARIFRSKRAEGAVFYRRQLRGKFELPFVFCFHEKLPGINTGRDRLNLTRKESWTLISKCLRSLSPETIRKLVLEDLRPYWTHGHPLLAELAEAYAPCYKDVVEPLPFPGEFCAWSYERGAQQEAVRSGKIICPGYMARFGMKSAAEVVAQARQGSVRPPAPSVFLNALLSEDIATASRPNIEVNELKAFLILKEAYESVARPGTARALPYNMRFNVFESESTDAPLHGFHDGKAINMERGQLSASFCKAFTTFTHEAEHKHGPDGSYAFARALKKTLANVVDNRGKISKLEAKWKQNVRRGNQLPMRLRDFAEAVEQIIAMGGHYEGKQTSLLKLVSAGIGIILGCDILTYPLKLEVDRATLPARDRRDLSRLLTHAESILNFYTTTNIGRKNQERHREQLLLLARELDPKNEDAHYALYILYWHDRQRYRKARTALDMAIKELPKSSALYSALGEMEFGSDKFTEAIAAFRRAEELLGKRATIFGELARVYRYMDDLPNTYKIIDEGIKKLSHIIKPPQESEEDEGEINLIPVIKKSRPARYLILDTRFREWAQELGRRAAIQPPSTETRLNEIILYYVLKGYAEEGTNVVFDQLLEEMKANLGKRAFSKSIKIAFQNFLKTFGLEQTDAYIFEDACGLIEHRYF